MCAYIFSPLTLTIWSDTVIFTCEKAAEGSIEIIAAKQKRNMPSLRFCFMVLKPCKHVLDILFYSLKNVFVIRKPGEFLPRNGLVEFYVTV